METNKSRWHSPSGGRGATEGSEYRQNYNRPRNNSYSHHSDNHYSNPERRRFHSDSEEQERKTFHSRYNSENPREGYRPRFNPDGEAPRPRRQRFVAGQEGSETARTPRYTRVDGRQNTPEGGYARPRLSSPARREGSVYTKRKQMVYRQQEVDPTKPVRLNKFLANAGICSRREADDFIQAGVITVNGEVVTLLGAKVLPTDKVMFHDQPVRSEHKVYILLNKPKDCVTTTDDPQDRKTVLDIVKNACAERIYPVGRLDRNTTGVLLLTNDGDLAAKLTHPKFGKKKIYAATLDHDLEQADYDTIMAGITLDDELIVPDALEFTHEDDRRHIGLEIHSGQNRVVRRIFEKVGYKVLQLDRVSFAGLTKKNVPRGKYRFLTPREVAMLQMGSFS
ncbi:MAG TPA: pseudouridine synthase [Bacteroidales bacterium]|mgnify:CR=1 FL=1|nr:pseudouridine synthase [Bacteroidales bacterium]